ncbi:MAG: hypothetical protein HYX80_00210 [Chloroflexi bacterium]|nr:hypothetical protein [Chloroflexota bacterium]
MCTRAVGALSRFFEEEGVPTTGISLVRLHTEKIKPPRALWVPFELGRPLGMPDDPAFQKRVMVAALKLLEAPAGPLIEDFPEDVPASTEEVITLACPVNFAQATVASEDAEQLHESLKSEIACLRAWYDIAVERRGRTTVGSSGLDVAAIGDLIYSFLQTGKLESPRNDIPPTNLLKLASDDFKAYYFEAITAQPGQEYASSQALTDWFWDETVAGKVMMAIKNKYENSEDRALRGAARGFLVPREVARLRKR